MSTAKASNKKRRTEPPISNSDHLDLDLDLSKYNFPIHRFFFFQFFHINSFFATSELIGYILFSLLVRQSKPSAGLERYAVLNPNRSVLGIQYMFQSPSLLALVLSSYCLTGIISKYEEKKERLCARYEQLRKRERSLISEHEKGCADKIAKLEVIEKEAAGTSLSLQTRLKTRFVLLFAITGRQNFQRSDEDIPADD
ncbi:hypothetical protein DVH24_017218 [Malus domestica]|uniref:Uncharacterized protein n=1 Tax=Malus domestica TaxID=3750 RepID=A0A498IVA2_MALDO|nr:hypothetical protein DVH24_017218 [Malus domestica]